MLQIGVLYHKQVTKTFIYKIYFGLETDTLQAY